MSFRKSVDVTPTSGNVDLTPYTAFKLRIGVAGDVKLQLKKDAPLTPVTFKNVQAGEYLEVSAFTVIQAGTTALNIILLTNK